LARTGSLGTFDHDSRIESTVILETQLELNSVETNFNEVGFELEFLSEIGNFMGILVDVERTIQRGNFFKQDTLIKL
jgi:hypothetical protein